MESHLLDSSGPRPRRLTPSTTATGEMPSRYALAKHKKPRTTAHMGGSQSEPKPHVLPEMGEAELLPYLEGLGSPVRQLEEIDINHDKLRAVVEVADARSHDADAQIAAAWANDSYGSETDAIRYHDAAWSAGAPAESRCRFMVGYGSTLRNKDRLDESIAIHRQAIVEYPTFAAHHVFLALALNCAGIHDEAMAEALTALIDAGGENHDGYDRSLRYYRDYLADES
jgi:hypothetical protein